MHTTNDPDATLLARKIAEADAKLEQLAGRIAKIGQPAAHELQRRLNSLQIEENALKRNFEESVAKGEPDAVRLGKIEALLHHIEAEESSLEHDSEFLQQAAPSSVILAAEAGAKVVGAIERTVRRVVGESHPFGSSVFVNHSHETLVERYDLEENEAADKPGKDAAP